MLQSIWQDIHDKENLKKNVVIKYHDTDHQLLVTKQKR